MRVERRDASDERRILTALIVDRNTLARITSRWEEGGLFRTKWVNLVADWCVDYFERYNKAPKTDIEALYETWAEKASDESTVDLVSKFLESLSNEYEALNEECNTNYILDLAGRHFNRVKLETMIDAAADELTAGQVEQAETRITNWGKVELGVDATIDVMHDEEAVRHAFDVKADPLIVFPGALGQFFGDALERDGFIGFMGPDKRGKSFWLLEIAFRGLLQRRKVALFQVGDLSEHQIIRRIMVRAARHPQNPGKIEYPISIEREKGDRVAEVIHKTKKFEVGLSWQRAYKAAQKVMKRKVKSQDSLLKVACYSADSINVVGIRAKLLDWEREEWTPDIVVIDYADILATDNYRLEKRDQIDHTWKKLRAMSQDLHCLVVTASQTDTAAYKTFLIDRSNFSDSKKKLAHVTGMIGLNQTPEEKDIGVIRLNWVVRREGSGMLSETCCVHVAGCLALANPAIRSCW